LVLLSYTGFSQQIEKTLYQPQMKICNVKSVKSIILKYNDGKIVDSLFSMLEHYNERGFIIKKELPWREEANRIIKYSYNEDDYLIRIDSLGLFNRGSSSFIDSTVFEKSEVFFIVAGQKKVLEKTSKIKGDTIVFQTKYDYNNSGQLINEVHFSGRTHNSLKRTHHIEYKYLECGALRKKVYFNAENKLASEHIRIYQFY
jgi:hypothetical protein